MLFVFEAGHSLLHRSDAVSKLVWVLAVTGVALVISDVVLTALLLGLVLAVGLVMGRVSLPRLARRLLPFIVIAAWFFVFMSFLSDRGGAPVIELGPLAASAASFTYGGALALRLLVLGTASSVFVLTTEPRRLISDLVRYARLPYRAGFAVYAALRFIPQIQAEARTIRHAHAVRADTGTRSPLGRLTALRRLTIPLLAGAIRRVRTTAIAMDARAFGAHPIRTELDTDRPHPAGVALAVVQVLLFIAAIAWAATTGGGAVQAPIGGN